MTKYETREIIQSKAIFFLPRDDMPVRCMPWPCVRVSSCPSVSRKSEFCQNG